MRRTAVAVLVATVVVAGCGDDEAVDTGDRAATTSSVESPTTRDTTTTLGPPASAGQPLVLTGPSGVEIRSPDGVTTQVSGDPAAVAFGIGTELVAFQDADPAGSGFPPRPAGPIRVWAPDGTRTLPTDADATRVQLLDASTVDGVPVALVAERFGEVGPEDTFEELVRIDLRDDTRTTMVRRPAWESGHFAARFLPDGDVIGLLSAEAQILLARWTTEADDPAWIVEVAIDTHVDLALRDGGITLVQQSFDESRDLTPIVMISERDAATGAGRTSEAIDVVDPGGEIDTGLSCHGWLTPTDLLCGRASGSPIVVSVSNGSFEQLPGEPGSVPTTLR